MGLKQFEVKKERVMNGHTFFVRPFPAFVSANLSGEVTALLVPIIGSIAPALGGGNLMDADVELAVSGIARGMATLSGDKVESLLKKLLVQHRNITVQLEGEREAEHLTEDLANEVFCGEAQDMFVLAADVVMVNFGGFFTKIKEKLGPLLEGFLEKVQKTSGDTERSTLLNFPSSN